MYSLWEGSFCPHFLFLHTSFLSRCTQACTPVLVGGITHSIRKQIGKNKDTYRSYYFYAFTAISTKDKMDWTQNWTRHPIFYDNTNTNKPDLIKAI